MSSEDLKGLEQRSFDDLVLPKDGSPISPSRFKSLVSNLRQKLYHVSSPQMNEADALLQQTMDDVACLSRLLRISEASLTEERKSSEAAQRAIQDLQLQLQSVSNDSNTHHSTACKLKSELEHCKEICAELQSEVNVLRDALCKSEAYRKDYAKLKKSELIDMQSKLDAAVSEATAQQEAHQRTRALLLSEVERRADTANAMLQLEAGFAELQSQHQHVQELCRAQEKEIKVRLCFFFLPLAIAQTYALARIHPPACNVTVTSKQGSKNCFIQRALPQTLRHSRQLRPLH